MPPHLSAAANPSVLRRACGAGPPCKGGKEEFRPAVSLSLTNCVLPQSPPAAAKRVAAATGKRLISNSSTPSPAGTAPVRRTSARQHAPAPPTRKEQRKPQRRARQRPAARKLAENCTQRAQRRRTRRREAGGKSRGETPDFKSFHAALTARPPAPAGQRSKQHPRSPARKGGQKTFTGKQRSRRHKAAGTASGFHKARAPSQTASPIPPSPAHKNRPAQPTAKGCAGRRVSVFGFQRLRE